MSGFNFPLGKREIFIVTNREYKCVSLARQILRKLLLPENPDTIRELLYWLQKSTLEEKEDFYFIKGDSFGATYGKSDLEIVRL